MWTAIIVGTIILTFQSWWLQRIFTYMTATVNYRRH